MFNAVNNLVSVFEILSFDFALCRRRQKYSITLFSGIFCLTRRRQCCFTSLVSYSHFPRSFYIEKGLSRVQNFRAPKFQ